MTTVSLSDTMNDTIKIEQWSDISDFLAYWLHSNPLRGAERKTFDTYYSGYLRRFGPYIRHHYAQQSQEMTALVRARGGPRLLEIGAGCGTEALWYALQGAHVTAIDLSVERLAAARARQAFMSARMPESMPSLRFVETSLFDFEPAEPFDLIWMEQTFHHLEPRQDVYPKLFSLLKPDGSVVISESNALNIPVQAQLFFRRGFKTRVRVRDPQGHWVEYGNERITTAGALSRGLRAAGFRIESIRSFRTLPNVDASPNLLELERRVVSLLPWMATHYNVVAVRPA
jgi:SAM-dependent methyltransferase